MSGPVLASSLRMQPDMPSRDPQAHAIIGAALEVHRILGSGFLEQVYQEALAREFGDRQLPFERDVGLRVVFKGRVLSSFYRVDFLCFDQVLVELKAAMEISRFDQAQMINHMKAGRFERGLILNFGRRSLEWKCFVFSEALHQAIDPQSPDHTAAQEV